MSETSLPAKSTDSRFGWPQHRRQEEFDRRKKGEKLPTHRVVFEGKPQDFSIIRMPINLPKYRMANGRTVSIQEEYLAKHQTARRDLFSGDPELLDAQEVQHGLLLILASEADLSKYFKDPANQQVDPILLDEMGFVVNGNRRLATWRELFIEEPGRYGHFSNIDAVVLPHCEEKEIDKIEAALQIQKDIKADYTWDAQANMMLQKRKRDGFTDKELADLYGMKESEVRELFDMLSYAAEYLRSRDKEHRWSLVSEHEFAFKKLVGVRSKIPTTGEQELVKQAAFILIDKSQEAGRRLYEAIPDIQAYIQPIKVQLQARFQVQPAADDAELEELFGGAPQQTDSIDVPLAAAIQKPENAEEARQIIVEVIDSQRQFKKEARTARFLLNCLAKANADLTSAISEGLRVETNIDGVDLQLLEIRRKLDHIEEWLASHA